MVIVAIILTALFCGQDEHLCEKRSASLKLKGADAFKRKEYLLAVQLYTDVSHCTSLLTCLVYSWNLCGNCMNFLFDITFFLQFAKFIMLYSFRRCGKCLLSLGTN